MIVRELIATFGLRTDPKGFQKAESSVSKLTRGLRVLGAVLVGGAVARGFRSLVETASDMEETANKFNAVFGDAAAGVQGRLADIAVRTGTTNTQLLEMSSNIGALIKPSLGSAEAAGKMAASVAELALDISSFNNVSADDALVAIRSGLIGSAEPLQRFGVDTRVAALELEALRQGISTNVKEMTEGQRVTLRYQAVLRQLRAQNALGDATRTAKGFANASKNLGLALKETAGIIGGFFLESAGGAVLSLRAMVDQFQMWLSVNREVIQQGVNKLIFVMGRVGNVILSVSRSVGRFAGVWLGVSNATDPFTARLIKITTVLIGLGAVILLLGSPLILLGLLIAAIIDDLEVMGEGGDSVFGDLLNSLQHLQAEWDFLVEAMKRKWMELTTLILTGIMNIPKLLGQLGSTIGRFLGGKAATALIGDVEQNNLVSQVSRLLVTPQATPRGGGATSVVNNPQTDVKVEIHANGEFNTEKLGSFVTREFRNQMDEVYRQAGQNFVVTGAQ